MRSPGARAYDPPERNLLIHSSHSTSPPWHSNSQARQRVPKRLTSIFYFFNSVRQTMTMPSAQKVYGRRVAKTTRYVTDFVSTANHDRFPTPLKRTASARRRRPPSSAPSKRQQTITQMDPFYSIYHPEIDTDELAYEADLGGTCGSPDRGSKRQKIMADETSVPGIPPQSPRTKALDIAPTSGKQVLAKIEKSLGDQNGFCEDLGSSKMMPPPPKTPTSRRRTEIPSSQSPADTPVSSSNRRRFSDCSRSPLKEKSLNIRKMHVLSPSKDGKLIDVGEVPDSLENDKQSSSIPSDNQREPKKPRKAAEEIYEELLAIPIPNFKSVEEWDRCAKRAETSCPKKTKQHSRPVTACGTHVRTEVMDSDMEEDEVDLDSKDEANIANSKVAVGSPLRQSSITAPVCDDISSSIPEENATRTTREAPRPASPSIDVPSSQPALPSSPPPTTTTQDLASDQLYHELGLYTQARGAPSLTTESQYENGWQSYHAPQASASIPPQSSLPLHPLSSPTGGPCASERETPPPTATLPTQLLPPTNAATGTTTTSNPAPSHKLLIPPSQATTIDATQPPSSSSSPPSSRHSHKRQKSPQILLPSSCPTPAPPALSSPPLMSPAQQDHHYQWDGRVLTDSQLLPASLMEDSLDLYEQLGGEWRPEGLEGDEEL